MNFFYFSANGFLETTANGYVVSVHEMGAATVSYELFGDGKRYVSVPPTWLHTDEERSALVAAALAIVNEYIAHKRALQRFYDHDKLEVRAFEAKYPTLYEDCLAFWTAKGGDGRDVEKLAEDKQSTVINETARAALLALGYVRT